MFQRYTWILAVAALAQIAPSLANNTPVAAAPPPPPPPPPPFVLKDQNTYFNDMKKAYVDGGYAAYEAVYLGATYACIHSALDNGMKSAGVTDVAEIHIPVFKYYFSKIYPIVFADEVALQNSSEQTFNAVASKTAGELVNQCSNFDKVVKQAIQDYRNKPAVARSG